MTFVRIVFLILTACATFMLGACGGGGGTSGQPVVSSCDTKNLITAQLSVTVSDPGAAGATPAYQWKSSDGCIVDVNAAKTSWTLPAGPGLHFAYVLVSNGKGGYTERRVEVNTDNLGIAKVVAPPANYTAPAAAAPTLGNYFRGGVISHGTYDTADKANVHAFMPDVWVYLKDTDPANPQMFPAGGPLSPAKTDVRGQYIIPALPPDDPAKPKFYQGYCSTDAGQTWDQCGAAMEKMPDYAATTYATNDYSGLPPSSSATNLLFHYGKVLLEDGSTCGSVNEFFQKEITGTAELLDAAGNVIGGPVRLSSYGDFSLRYNPKTANVRISCEAINPLLIPVNTGNVRIFGLTKLTGYKAPVVSAMTAEINGVVVATLPTAPANPLPSDRLPDAEQFFSIKGIDSRKGACQYYKAIGAVRDCDASGKLIGAINFEDWKRTVGVVPYDVPGGPKEYSATYINQVDLNLTRNQHSISYGPDNTAAYVCNHKGPQATDQASINTAISNAAAGKDLIACVAMDYRKSSGVNSDKPFTRFLIFGPSGELLPSVNLDGRREKFVPGTCVVCHGGDKYAGKFPEDGTGFADIGGYFLPYDIGNFAFSDAAGLTRADQEEAIYQLNQNVLRSGPTVGAQELIAGWYPNNTHTMDTLYLPPSWQEANLPAIYKGKNMDKLYHTTVARSCRTCHVNLQGSNNFDRITVDQAGSPSFSDRVFTYPVCGQISAKSKWISYSMANSIVTFNRFWQSTNTLDDQVAPVTAFIKISTPTAGPCNLAPLP
ncbi:MAG: hypothetical protein HY080_17700 [Gammaproteobacteria bacterium]|nr:hypothetical protein [Gammaproteobacteria bacterium]